MKITAALAALALLCACAPVQVTHPTNDAVQMQADVDLCTDQANKTYWMDPVAAMYNAYDCLEAKGYQRDSSHVSSKVEKALGEAKKQPPGPAKACAVPCRRD